MAVLSILSGSSWTTSGIYEFASAGAGREVYGVTPRSAERTTVD